MVVAVEEYVQARSCLFTGLSCMVMLRIEFAEQVHRVADTDEFQRMYALYSRGARRKRSPFSKAEIVVSIDASQPDP